MLVSQQQEHHFVPEKYISKLSENFYLGASLCLNEEAVSHQQVLSDYGVNAQISMRQTQEVIPSYIKYYLWLPTVDDTAPSLLKMHLAADFIYANILSGNKVYVHCKLGHGRAPTIAAAYFIIKQGFTVDEALKFITEKRPEVHPLPSQIEMLHTLYNELYSSSQKNS